MEKLSDDFEALVDNALDDTYKHVVINNRTQRDKMRDLVRSLEDDRARDNKIKKHSSVSKRNGNK